MTKVDSLNNLEIEWFVPIVNMLHALTLYFNIKFFVNNSWQHGTHSIMLTELLKKSSKFNPQLMSVIFYSWAKSVLYIDQYKEIKKIYYKLENFIIYYNICVNCFLNKNIKMTEFPKIWFPKLIFFFLVTVVEFVTFSKLQTVIQNLHIQYQLSLMNLAIDGILSCRVFPLIIKSI
jgi:hypothetical protein